ncbi:MAG: hypothetical protein EXQ98_04815 [Alphaproteobacteria bacterium]|nr:hypothetical protein [Alphaproteobacteria bacterium]
MTDRGGYRQAQRPAAQAPVKRGSQASTAVGLIVLSGLGGALAFYALPIFFLVYGGLAPSFIAFSVDARPGRHLATTVALFNAAGLVLACEPLFSSMMFDAIAFDILGAPDTWVSTFGFSLAGWMLAAMLPALTSEAYELIVTQRRRSIEQVRAGLRKKWPSLTGEAEIESWSAELDAGKPVSEGPATKNQKQGGHV